MNETINSQILKKQNQILQGEKKKKNTTHWFNAVFSPCDSAVFSPNLQTARLCIVTQRRGGTVIAFVWTCYCFCYSHSLNREHSLVQKICSPRTFLSQWGLECYQMNPASVVLTCSSTHGWVCSAELMDSRWLPASWSLDTDCTLQHVNRRRLHQKWNPVLWWLITRQSDEINEALRG